MISLYKHQEGCLEFLKDKQQAALLMDMGTGKTLTILNQIKRYNTFPCLIITKNSIKHNWLNEIRQAGFKEEDAIILSGSTEKKAEMLKRNHLFFILNYESVRLLTNDIIERGLKGIILDESTAIKNPATKVTKAILKIGKKIPSRYILTGTPVTNNPLDAFSQFQFLDEKILFFYNFFAFRNYYCRLVERNFGGRRFKEVIGYQNLPELISRIKPYSFMIKKEECLDLPEKIYETRIIEMEAEQARLYKELKEELITEIDSSKSIVVSNILTKLLRLQQILGGNAVAENGENISIKENKTAELLGTLEEINGYKSVIWARFTAEIKRIHSLLIAKGYKAKMIYGEVKPIDRQEIVDSFNQGETQIIIAQQQTAGFGLNLIGGNYAIYYSNDWSLQNRQQSEDRIYRIGQTRKTTIIDLITRGTMEESIVKALRVKKGFQDMFFRNNQIGKNQFSNMLGGILEKEGGDEE